MPSLPGFAFSEPLRTTGIGVREVARLWLKLMRDVLGCPRFAAAGGDWGALITAELGHAHPEVLHGIHLTLPMVPDMNPLAIPAAEFAANEAWMVERQAEATPTITSHLAVHRHDPHTLAYAPADAPVGTEDGLATRVRVGGTAALAVAGVQDASTSGATTLSIALPWTGGHVPLGRRQ